MVQLFDIYSSQVFPKNKFITGDLIKKPPKRKKSVVSNKNTIFKGKEIHMHLN